MIFLQLGRLRGYAQRAEGLMLLRKNQRNYFFGLTRCTGNGKKPTLAPPQPGCCRVAPLWPQVVHRAQCRSLSLEVLSPYWMTGAAQASGAKCGHFSQLIQIQRVARCKSPSVVFATVDFTTYAF
jgi:hypothetical protein